jgi:hypothetical protein
MAIGYKESIKSSNNKFKKGLKVNTLNLIRRTTRGGTRL